MGELKNIRIRALQSRDAIELLSNKWRVTVLHLLSDGPHRANQIQRAMAQVSPKVLTETLRGLERDGLIHREVLHAVPAHVQYTLTEMGSSVIPPLRALCHWAKAHAAIRDEARRKFDGQRRNGKSSSKPALMKNVSQVSPPLTRSTSLTGLGKPKPNPLHS